MAESKEEVKKVPKHTGGDPIYPAVAQYGPYTVENLEPGKRLKWCTCGLSKKQPWCDESHKGTAFRSHKFEIAPDQVQSKYTLCGCKYTKNPPFCDGTHNMVACEVKERQENCAKKGDHCDQTKLCVGCGFVPDF